MDKLYDRPEICRTYFFPQPDVPLPRQEHAAPVALRLPGGERLGGYWSRPLVGAPTLLYLHGNGERIADQLGHWPDWARRAGANIFFLDYPGYASSAGQPTLSSCAAAATAALTHLLERPEREVPAVLLAGRSVGSLFALDAAARSGSRRVRGLLLESGIADLKIRLDLRLDYARDGIDRGALQAAVDEDFDQERKLRALRCPVLVLHTRQDSLVPCWNGERLAAWAGPRLHRLVLFADGDHNDIQWVNGPDYLAALTEFVAAATGAGPPAAER